MRFTFDKDTMIKEISIAQEIISTKNMGSILSNILIIAQENKLTIKATDIKVNFETQVPVQITEEGTTTVYCDKFMGILNSLPSGEIEFNQEKKENEEQSINVIIKPVDKKIKFQMKSMSQEKFPEFYSAENVPYFEVSSKDIKEMIAQTSFAVSEDETRYFMNGVFFEKKGDNLNMVATDGRRLSFVSKSILAGISEFPSAIVHPKILNIILKHAPEEGNIFVAVVDKMIFFKFGNYKFGAALLEGQFPNYERVIPEHQAFNFQVCKADLVDALKRVALMVDKKAGRIFFNISDGVLKITSSQSDMGSADEEIPCQYQGNSYTIALNFRYIEEPLRGINSEKIAFEFTEEMKAVTMRPEPAEDYFHIIMPMQKE
ncbi:DNA polymerase III subunit beta [uncultured Treponema sp.]|uniref:DNA polymerase III subunit beta n=1 Tax=uncultured Treponema sp. TaxID=162155 RepID=UPI00280401B4|nr:DNA polymerase III subunit beta [uncultured Treponema sp.]